MGLIETPTMIAAAGNPPKRIAEYVGRLNTGSVALSIARMVSPGGWQEPGQTPEFNEYTLVLRGSVRVETRTGLTKRDGRTSLLRRRGRLGALHDARREWRRVYRDLCASLLARGGP